MLDQLTVVVSPTCHDVLGVSKVKALAIVGSRQSRLHDIPDQSRTPRHSIHPYPSSFIADCFIVCIGKSSGRVLVIESDQSSVPTAYETTNLYTMLSPGPLGVRPLQERTDVGRTRTRRLMGAQHHGPTTVALRSAA